MLQKVDNKGSCFFQKKIFMGERHFFMTVKDQEAFIKGILDRHFFMTVWLFRKGDLRIRLL
jgi:hypothetical protein